MNISNVQAHCLFWLCCNYRDDAGIQALERHEAALRAQKAQQRSLREGRITAFNSVLLSFLDKEYKYMKKASTKFPEEITSDI